MSFTFEDVKHAKPSLKIVDEGRSNNKLIYIDPNTHQMEKMNNSNGLKIPNNSSFQLAPDTSHERDAMMVVGPSGSGKSDFVETYCDNT